MDEYPIEFYERKNNTHVIGVKQYTGTIINLLNNITWSVDLTENDLKSLRESLSDLKETIEDVEFSLFNAQSNKNFIEANKGLGKL